MTGIASGLLAGIVAAVLVKIAESKFSQLTGKGFHRSLLWSQRPRRRLMAGGLQSLVRLLLSVPLASPTTYGRFVTT